MITAHVRAPSGGRCGLARLLRRGVAGFCVAALFFAVAVPHAHATTDHSHQQSACRACKLQDGFSVTPQALPASSLPAAVVAAVLVPGRQAVRALFVARHFSSRAPPTLS